MYQWREILQEQKQLQFYQDNQDRGKTALECRDVNSKYQIKFVCCIFKKVIKDPQILFRKRDGLRRTSKMWDKMGSLRDVAAFVMKHTKLNRWCSLMVLPRNPRHKLHKFQLVDVKLHQKTKNLSKKKHCIIREVKKLGCIHKKTMLGKWPNTFLFSSVCSWIQFSFCEVCITNIGNWEHTISI